MEAVPCGGVMLSTLQTALEDEAFGWVPAPVQSTAMCDKGIRALGVASIPAHKPLSQIRARWGRIKSRLQRSS
jgi:hypothetical protein